MDERVLLVIPCLNEEAHLTALVEQFVKASENLPMHIVIADGGSTDHTPQIAKELEQKYKNISYMQNPKRIQAAGINLAVATYGDGPEFLIRIDAHAEYPIDYCTTLVNEAEATKADSVVVTMNTIGKEGLQLAIAAAQNSLLGNGGSAHRNEAQEGKWVNHGHHALMRIEAFRKVGAYDETFSHNEDAELDTRLQQAGCKIWLTEKTSIFYYPRASFVALFQQYMQFGYGRARNLLKHRTRPKLRQIAPAAVLPALLLAILFGHLWWVFTLPIKIWVILCLGYGAWLAIDANNFIVAWAGPAAMVMHFAWSVGFWWGGITEFIRRRK